MAIDVDGEGVPEQPLELVAALLGDAHRLGERDVRRGFAARRELDGASEVLLRAARRVSARARAGGFVADEERVYRAALEGLVELERAIDQGLHGRQLGEGLRRVLREADERAPGNRRPVKQRHVRALEARRGASRIALQLSRDPWMRERHRAQAVIACPTVKATRALVQRRGA